ncbi:hypothetical protein [Paenibacillus flagellatus]|uniref:Uncharacterized protein n=1 Tax=Paenibacillus flagellatus TaxID=2211139 RepID=A0A2V5JZR9_9BACL|nr:hypothetical protein [Paenibacillus flagellatus]PYI52445.1 hypothetical protein DLM86_19885 [Paenibacillus flagellatus]
MKIHNTVPLALIAIVLSLFLAGCGSTPDVDLNAYNKEIDKIVKDSLGVVRKVDKEAGDWSVFYVTVSSDWYNTTETNKKRLAAMLHQKILQAANSAGAKRNVIMVVIKDQNGIKVAEVNASGDVEIKM